MGNNLGVMKTSSLRRRQSTVNHWDFLLVDADQTDVFMVDVDHENISLVWTTDT